LGSDCSIGSSVSCAAPGAAQLTYRSVAVVTVVATIILIIVIRFHGPTTVLAGLPVHDHL